MEREQMKGYQWGMAGRASCKEHDWSECAMPLELPGGEELLVSIQAHGRSDKVAQYQLLCEYRGIKFSVGFGEWVKCRPNCAAECGSLAAMSLGIDEFRRVVKQVIGALGGEIERGTWKRVDFAVDFAGVGIEEFVNPYIAGDYIARAGASEIFMDEASSGSVHFKHRRVTGLTHGQGVKLRIYDKIAEACKGDKEKLAFLEEHRFKGAEKCSRVEFQFRAEHLRRFELEDWEKSDEMRETITTWAVQKWFRLAADVDRNHADRALVLPVWALVQRAFAEVYGRVAELPKARKAAGASRNQLAKQAFGVIAALAAIMNGDGAPVSWKEAVAEVVKTVACPFEDKVIVKKLQRGHLVVPNKREVPEVGDCDLT